MVSFVNYSLVRHHVSMSKSKAENRYWASDFDSQCGSHDHQNPLVCCNNKIT